ncbi:MAG: energy transducer TonB [Opitutales bacterium]|nr:energy transducer TonB [Opitutales bacterium]
MRTCFSWLKKSVEDTERVSSGAAALACLLLFAGTLALASEKSFLLPDREAAEAVTKNVPAKIVLRLENFVPVTEVAEIENAPEEMPPAPEIPAPPEPLPEPPKETPAPEKIDESAIRETLSEQPAPEIPRQETPPPEPEKAPETPPEEPPPEQKPQEFVPPPQIAQQPPPSPPVPAPVEDSAAKAAAEQTLYGALAESVSRKKFYPKTARRNGRTGTVFMRVSISSDGEISGFSVEKASAHKSLVSGAKETLRRVAEDFSAPAGTRAALPAEFVVPIIYELN